MSGKRKTRLCSLQSKLLVWIAKNVSVFFVVMQVSYDCNLSIVVLKRF